MAQSIIHRRLHDIWIILLTSAKNIVKDAAWLSMARWYNKEEEAGSHSLNVIAATFHEHNNDMLNF